MTVPFDKQMLRVIWPHYITVESVSEHAYLAISFASLHTHLKARGAQSRNPCCVQGQAQQAKYHQTPSKS